MAEYVYPKEEMAKASSRFLFYKNETLIQEANEERSWKNLEKESFKISLVMTLWDIGKMGQNASVSTGAECLWFYDLSLKFESFIYGSKSASILKKRNRECPWP